MSSRLLAVDVAVNRTEECSSKVRVQFKSIFSSHFSFQETQEKKMPAKKTLNKFCIRSRLRRINGSEFDGFVKCI